MTVATTLVAAALAFPSTGLGFDPEREGRNYAKTSERERYVTKTPEFQARLARQNAEDNADLAEIAAAEAAQGENARNFTGNVCFQRKQECAGDVRFYDWASSGFGSAQPVLFGGRSGATLSGTVWATPEGPAKRPGIVITTGSVQAPETLYWGIAAALARNGYVVLTYDVQGQGRSDTFGVGADRGEGFPSQAGQPFFDGTEDALDFLLSTPASPYDPRRSCSSGTDHSDKHDARVAAGLNASFNPFWEMVDPGRIGIAGHSLGAGAVSYVGQIDDRVDAIVAWDNLRPPSSHSACPSGAAPRPDDPPITKPAIGMSNDYGLVATPNQSDPNPERANAGFEAYRAAGVDSMQVNRRGGTHYEYSFIPGQTVPALGLATLRGMDMATWYTIAWFDRYVKGDPGALARLLTDRWRDDRREGEVDPSADSNLYSFYLRSRFDLRDAAGAELTCDDMRAGCPAMGPDGGPADYSMLADAYSVGSSGTAGEGPGASKGPPCALAQSGAAGRDTLRGTDAGDALRGARGADRLLGRAGDDCLDGERGRDVVSGGPGRDRVNAADGARDVVSCGPGRRDVATIDPGDAVRGCERIRAS